MSVVDKLKGIFGKGKTAVADNADKIKDKVADNADKIKDGVDKAGGLADKATKGKFSDKIEKGTEAAKKAVPDKKSGEPEA